MPAVVADGRREPRDAGEVALVMSGGTEGGAVSPHWLVFEARPAISSLAGKALAIGRVHTPALPPEAIGRAPRPWQLPRR